ncbi:hypothetical protein FRX31_033837, partial [Thalictrum thalictroides]
MRSSWGTNLHMTKLVSWNARGLCNLDAQGSVKSLLKLSKANVVMIQETKVRDCIDGIGSLVFPNGWRWECVPSMGLSGG